MRSRVSSTFASPSFQSSTVSSFFNTDFVRLYLHNLTPAAIPWAYMCEGPDDCNGYGYLLVRLYCTGLGFQANIVEEYVLWSSLQHIFAGLKRTRDQKLSSGSKSGHLNLSSLFHRRETCAVECFAAHLHGCWRSLIYCGVYLLPKVLHDSSEYRFLYSAVECVTAHACCYQEDLGTEAVFCIG